MQYILFALLLLCLVLLAAVLSKLVRRQDGSKETEALSEALRHLENAMTVTATRIDEMDRKSAQLNSLVDERLSRFSTQISGDSERLTKAVEGKLSDIRNDNEKRLEQMRQVVEEKLQSTLETRLSTSFKQVGEQLESVYKQLGEMQALAKGVDNLEKVLTNVKTRGMWGELQAERILQEILLPEQYLKNAVTKKGGRDSVEFAVRLPGANEGEYVLLPIDSKFPREDYERLCDATEVADTEAVRTSRKSLERRVLDEAKTIREKYIDVPNTTDFAIMFLPIEGLYAEVLSIPGLQERIQHEFHIMVSGPATLASLLNSLQMGFRTLAIEKKSSEVWRILGEVKTEYAKFGIVLDTVKRKLTSATNEIDNAFTRHRAMGRKLRGVEMVQLGEPENALAELPEETEDLEDDI
ncbi:MAG: DNA recombination protein RmuC [Sphaerochaeta sp.]